MISLHLSDAQYCGFTHRLVYMVGEYMREAKQATPLVDAAGLADIECEGALLVMPGGTIVPVHRLELLALWLGLVAFASLGAAAFALWVQRDHG